MPGRSHHRRPRLIANMAHRTFRDEHGLEWSVWQTIPTTRHVKPELASGWLTFEARGFRKRLVPIPPEWDARTDAELLALCAEASHESPRKRLPE